MSDFIDTRRGSIGPEARTRLSEATRQLEAAQAKRATNPAEAIAHANGAAMLAAQAQSLANDDVRAAQQCLHPAVRAAGGGSDMGAVIGGIIIGNILRRRACAAASVAVGAAASAAATAAAAAGRLDLLWRIVQLVGPQLQRRRRPLLSRPRRRRRNSVRVRRP